MTRSRLIEAAERVFIRKGFDEATVEDISGTAGYTRGAFYSNFDSKEQVLLAVIDSHQLRAFDGVFQKLSDPVERITAIRNWFSHQWRTKDLVALRMEFSRRAMRDRSVRKHLAELRRRELETYAAFVRCYLDATGGALRDTPEVVALVLWAVAHGLGSLAIDVEPDQEHMYMEAAKLAFDRMSSPPTSHLGETQC